MKNSPLVSIIIPVYNVQDYLEACLDSVVNQTYTNLEILLINDGSTDNSEGVCLDFVNKDSRFHYFTKSNGGLSSARNFGLDKFNGEYVSFLDSDDILHYNYIELLVNYIADADLIYALHKPFFFDSELNLGSNVDVKLREYNREDFLSKIVYNYTVDVIIACNKLFKSSIWFDLRFKEGKYHEDEFAIHHIADRCKKIISLDCVLYYYRQRETSITQSFSINKFNNQREAFLDRISFLENKFLLDMSVYVYNHYYILLLNSKISADSNYFKDIHFISILNNKKLFIFNKLQLLLKKYFTSFYNNVFVPLNSKRMALRSNKSLCK